MVSELKISKEEFLKKDEEFLSPALYRVFNIVVEKGEGPYLITVDGEKYLDLTAGIGVTQLGHCHEEVTKAAKDQLDKLIHTNGVVHQVEAIKLAEKMSKILPGNLQSTFFCNSGAEAVEGAIKLSRYANPGRPNIISFLGGFHGRTLGAISLSSSKLTMRKKYYPLLPGINFVTYPKDNSEKTLEEINTLFKLSIDPESVSSFLIEPVLGEGGYIPCPKDFLKELQSICKKYGILLICDEVQSGIGRTGKWYASEHYDIVPDIITTAKGIANGIPMGAFSASKELMYKMSPGCHGSTFGGNAIACVSALKTLEIIDRENILKKVSSHGEKIINYLNLELKSKAIVRGLGYMIGIELESKEICEKVTQECFKEKILLLTCGVDQKTLRLIPALNIDESLLNNAVDKIISIIKKNYL